jgi:hypothetical protein
MEINSLAMTTSMIRVEVKLVYDQPTTLAWIFQIVCDLGLGLGLGLRLGLRLGSGLGLRIGLRLGLGVRVRASGFVLKVVYSGRGE